MLKQTIAIAGNFGGKIRSDCQVIVEPSNAGGVVVDLKSKVKTMYGRDIILQVHRAMSFFGLENVMVTLADSGALPWVIDARIEAAVRELAGIVPDYLPPRLNRESQGTEPERRRFSRLYLPGNNPSLMINAFLHRPDGLILDLEDAVAPEKKAEARVLVRNALRSVDFGNSERMVRINQIPDGLADLDWIIPQGVDLVLIPKCESAGQVLEVVNKIREICGRTDRTAPVWLMPIIESALGVTRAFEIATADPSVVALAIGLEDYTADMGVSRTMEGNESIYARSVVVNACKAAKIQAIDSVFSDVGDMEGLKSTVLKSKAMGFDGMGCIHPRQIQVIHENFAPGQDEISKAGKIVLAYMEARKRGLSVVAVGTKMIDPPVIKRAEKTIGMALELGLIKPDWFESIS